MIFRNNIVNKHLYDYVHKFKLDENYRRFIPFISNNTNGITREFKNESTNYSPKTVIDWCNNNYNNMAHNKNVKNKFIKGIQTYGCGAGGTRNIGGTHDVHNKLEKEIAEYHSKERGLIFNSGYLANMSSIQALGKLFPDAIMYSDRDNHASIIEGVRGSKLKYHIFNHNDINHLEYLIQTNIDNANDNIHIIIVESIYSMDGSIADLQKIVDIKKKYENNCLIYVDEIHAAGVYGYQGSGIVTALGLQDDVDIIMGGFGKAFGLTGGYITGNNYLIDAIRLTASGFIFTTAAIPGAIDAIRESIIQTRLNHKYNHIRRLQAINYFKQKALETKLPLIKNNNPYSHIIAIKIGCSYKTNIIHKKLLDANHYIQPINYPTVPYGTERLRVSIKPHHTPTMIDDLIDTLKDNLEN